MCSPDDIPSPLLIRNQWCRTDQTSGIIVDYETIKQQLEKGNRRANESLTFYAESDMADIVTLLLSYGVDEDSIRDAFIGCVGKNAYTTAKILLEHHNSILTNETQTALKICCLRNFVKLFKLLLLYGADVKLDENVLLKNTLAYGHDWIEIIKLLVENGVDINCGLVIASTYDNDDAVRFFLEQGADPNTNNGKALIKSIYSIKIVKLLLQAGADVHAKNNRALKRSIKSYQYDTTKLLIEHGADLLSLNDILINRSNSSVMLAELLLEQNVDPLVIINSFNISTSLRGWESPDSE